MRFPSIAILVMLVASGCATHSHDDVIDRVARALERSQFQDLAKDERRTFPSQMCVCIALPSNAPPARVATEALKTDPENLVRSLAEGHPVGYGSTRVLRVRKVRIQSPEYERAFPESDPVFAAVLMDTSVGRRVVLLQYIVLRDHESGPTGCWEHWIIDPDRLLDEASGANAGKSAQVRCRTVWGASIGQFICRSATSWPGCHFILVWLVSTI